MTIDKGLLSTLRKGDLIVGDIDEETGEPFLLCDHVAMNPRLKLEMAERLMATAAQLIEDAQRDDPSLERYPIH